MNVIKMCLDLFIKRDRYQSENPAQAVTNIVADSEKVFTKLDAMKGYHQCPLDEESQPLTIFITPLGSSTSGLCEPAIKIQAGSRFVSDTDSRYAVISWAIIKCKMFSAGLQHFTIITDYHPLIPILNNHRLDEIENP